MNQILDYFNRKEKPELILCNPSFVPVVSLGASYNVINTLRFNAIGDLEFDFPKSTDNGASEVVGYSKIQVKMVVKVEGVGYYIISECPEDSGGETPVKHVIAGSIESELLRKRVTALSGTFKFYDPSLLAGTLMGRILKLAPGWGMGYVDPELAKMYRTFDVGDNTVYNFLITDVEQAYSCVFTFDALSKVIHAKLIKNLADNIDAYFSFDNISKSMSLTEYSDEIVTAMSCYGGTDLDIHRANPLGGNIIYNFDYYINSQNDWMSQDLKDSLVTWKYKTLNESQTYAQNTLAQNLVVEKLVTIRQTVVELESVLTALELEHEGLVASPIPKEEPFITQRTTKISTKTEEIANQRIAIRTARRQKADYKAEIDTYSAKLRKLTSSLKFTGEESWQSFCEDIAQMLERMQTISTNWKTVYYETADVLELTGAQLIASTPGIETAISRAKDSLETLLISASEKQLSYWTLDEVSIESIVSNIRICVDYIEVAYGLLNSLISNTDMVIDLHSEMLQLESYADVLGQESNLTRDQFANLQNFIFDNTYTNNNLITTDLMTEKDIQEVSQELYNQAVDVLTRASAPRYEFSGDFLNILTLPQYSDIVSRLDLGKQVTIEMAGGEVLDDVALLEMSYNYEDPTASTMVFSNRIKLNTSNWKFADLFIGSSGDSSGVSGITGGGGSTDKAGAITASQSLTGTNLLSVTNALISKLGYVSFGPTPPTKYGNYVGSWLGYDLGAKFSLYSSANDYMQWDGSKLLIKARNFTLDSYGNITANNANLAGTITAQSGAIGGWNIEDHALSSSSGSFTLNSNIPALEMGYASASMVGEGVYIGGGPGAYSFRVGDPLGDYFSWDKDGISIAGSWIAGWRISPTSLESGTGSNIVGISSASIVTLRTEQGQGVDYPRPAFWAGNPAGAGASGSGALFQVWHDGRLFATEATISGSITANSGDIGGWNVKEYTITDDSGMVGLNSESKGVYDVRFWAGGSDIESAPFRIDEQGDVFASSGSIGGWKILPTALQSGDGNVGMSTASAVGDNLRFWAGSASTVVTPPFYVKQSGYIHAQDGDIAGWHLSDIDNVERSIASDNNMVGMSSFASGNLDAIRFWAGNTVMRDAPFWVKEDGSLHSTKGNIGSWVIGSGSLTNTSGCVGMTTGDYAFYAGAENGNPADGDFYVTPAGHLYANEAEISGSITATSGRIGGWGITNTAIEKGGISLNSNASRITVGDTSHSLGVIMDGNGGYLSSANYVPDWAGFKIENNGNAEFNNVNVRGEIRSAVFKYDEVSAVAGTLGVFKSSGTLLENVIVTPGVSPFTIKTALPYFELGDIIRIKDVYKKDMWASISGSGGFSGSQINYTCDIKFISSGSYEFSAGTSIVDYGVEGNGFLYMEANDNKTSGSLSGVLGPYYSVRTTSASPWLTGGSEVVRLGSLGGTNTGISLDGQYGIAMGNSSGSMGYLTYDPLNGLRIKGQVVITGGSGSETPTVKTTPNITYSVIMPRNSVGGDYWLAPSSGSMFQYVTGSWVYSGRVITQDTPPTGGSGLFWTTNDISGSAASWDGSKWDTMSNSILHKVSTMPTSSDVIIGDFWINTVPYVDSIGNTVLVNTMHVFTNAGSEEKWVPVVPGYITSASAIIKDLSNSVYTNTEEIIKKTETFINVPSPRPEVSVFISSASPIEDILYWYETTGSVIYKTDGSPIDRGSGSILQVGDFWISTQANSGSASIYQSGIWNELNRVATSASMIRSSGSPSGSSVQYGDYWLPSGGSVVFSAYTHVVKQGDIYYDMSGSSMYMINIPEFTSVPYAIGDIDTPLEHYAMLQSYLGDVWYNTLGDNSLNIYTSDTYPFNANITSANIINYCFKPVTASPDTLVALNSKSTVYYANDTPVSPNVGDLWIKSDNLLYKYSSNGIWEVINLAYLTTADKSELNASIQSFSNDNIVTIVEKAQSGLLYNIVVSEGDASSDSLIYHFDEKLSALVSASYVQTFIASASQVRATYANAYMQITTGSGILSDGVGYTVNGILALAGSTTLDNGAMVTWSKYWNDYNSAQSSLSATLYSMTALMSNWGLVTNKMQSLTTPRPTISGGVTGLYLTSDYVGFYNADRALNDEWTAYISNGGNFHLGGKPEQGATGLDWKTDGSTGSTTGTTGSLTLGNANIDIYDGTNNKVLALSAKEQYFAIGRDVTYANNNGVWMGKGLSSGSTVYQFRVGNPEKGIKWTGEKLTITGGDILLGTSSGSPTLHISPGTEDINAGSALRFPFVAMGNPTPKEYGDSNIGIWMGRDPYSLNTAIISGCTMSGSDITSASIITGSWTGSGSFILASDNPRYTFRVGDIGGAYFGWSGSWITLMNAHTISVEPSGTLTIQGNDLGGGSLNLNQNASLNLASGASLNLADGAKITGKVVIENNTSYTTAQARNIILSTGNAVIGSMGLGDIWIKYM